MATNLTGDDPEAISHLLANAAASAREELSADVEIEDCESFPASFYVEARKWKRIDDVVALAVDLKNSTKLTNDRRGTTAPRIYEAVTGNCVRLIKAFNADFMDIQGDGMFALFHGPDRYRRAICAAVTVKTFGQNGLIPAIEQHVREELRDTGLKLGMAAGTLTVKRVGKSRDQSEPIWAGRAVNWATKCASHADSNELILAERVFNKIKDNDYLRYSCGCGNVRDLWRAREVQLVPGETFKCFSLGSLWCQHCGDVFCAAVVDGQTRRDDIAVNRSIDPPEEGLQLAA